jgi:hypothetical protein
MAKNKCPSFPLSRTVPLGALGPGVPPFTTKPAYYAYIWKYKILVCSIINPLSGSTLHLASKVVWH